MKRKYVLKVMGLVIAGSLVLSEAAPVSVRAASAAAQSSQEQEGQAQDNLETAIVCYIDTKNGNAYLTIDTDARQKMTIYWPVPKDFDSDNSFYIVHFETLDRNYDYLDEALSADSPKIIPSELVNIAGTKYVKFETGSFSPFVLVYEKKSSSEGSTHDNYTLRYDTNGSETIKSESKNSSWTKKYEELPVPGRDGYTFEGWYFDSKLTELVEDDIRINRSTITLYAGWSKNMSHPNNNGVSSWLNSEEHDSYLNGYGNGTF